MLRLATACSTLEVCLVWKFTMIIRARGILVKMVKGSHWHQPEIVVWFLEDGHKTIFGPNRTPSLIIEIEVVRATS